jgi:tetratricopeptide (TPR) repeat protein
LMRAIAMDPALVEARVTLAQALARTGRRAEAREQQDAVERINAEKAALGRAMLLVDSARDLLNRAEPEGALPLLKEAVALAPGLAEAHFQLSIALNRAEAQGMVSGRDRGRSDKDGAIEAELRSAIERDPAHAQAHFNLGIRCAIRGDTPSALASLRRAVSVAPSLVPAQRALADFAVRGEDWQTAVSALEAVLAWEPEDVPAALTLTSVLLHQRDCAGATALYQRATHLDSKRASSERELAASLKRCEIQRPSAAPAGDR